METEEGAPYILYELPDINLDIAQPIQCTQRLKYTCFDVSKKLLVFGATSGGIYVFHRLPISFFHLIPNKEGPITHIKISPNEKYVCFANTNGIVFIKEFSQQTQTASQQVSREHQGKDVTSMMWNDGSQELWIGDSAGNVSIMHITTFITKPFNTSTFTLMRLDSKIVQIDLYLKMLLISTLTRTYLCDTEREQYQQIGQKLRDGEFGACFISTSQTGDFMEDTSSVDKISENSSQNIKKYSSMAVTDKLNGCENKNYLKIISARPGLRMWEAAANGSVIKTYQFKQQLSSRAQIITNDILEREQLEVHHDNNDVDIQILNFSQLHPLWRNYICTHSKNCLFILDPRNGSLLLWSTLYKDIKVCRVYDSFVYLSLDSGSIVVLNYVKLDKFIVNMYINKKYLLCANLCAIYDKYLISNANKLHRLSLLTKLGDTLIELNLSPEYDKIKHVLDELANAKQMNAQKLKSGIFVVQNAFYSQSEDSNREDERKKSNDVTSDEDGYVFPAFPPDAIQALKDLSLSVSDKLSVGTKKLKEKFDRSLGVEKYEPLEIMPVDRPYIIIDDIKPIINNDAEVSEDIDFVVKINSSHNPDIKSDYSNDNEDVIRRLYHLLKIVDSANVDMLETADKMLYEIAGDIVSTYGALKKVENYAMKMNDSNILSLNHCGKLFLYHISKMDEMDSAMETIIHDEDLCNYFSTACMPVKVHSENGEKSVSCECGYPLPNLYSSQSPQFSNVIDLFIEMQWKSSQSKHCYDICKKVPYMWRKILYLRRNENLKNLLILLLQMLDEDLLYTYLPHFTVDVWEKAVQLFATIKSNLCLNCGRKFVKDITESVVSWDVIGALMIKSIGGRNAVKILKNFAGHIPMSGLSLAFYHSSALAILFDKYDSNLRMKLTDTIYEAYKYPGTLDEVIALLNSSSKNGSALNTSLPFAVASKSQHWGLKTSVELQSDQLELTWFSDSMTRYVDECDVRELTTDRCLSLLDRICPNKDCLHCSLPLNSPVLIEDGGLWVFVCGHTFHGPCLRHLKVKLCPICVVS